MSGQGAGVTPQNATRGDFVKQIRRLQWYLGLIAARPLEFNTKSTALAQEALSEIQLIDPDGSALLWLDELGDETRDKILRRSSQFGANDAVLKPRGGEAMHRQEKTEGAARVAQEPAKVTPTGTTTTTTSENLFGMGSTTPPPPPEVVMLDVESTNLKRIGHDGDKLLRVQFHPKKGEELGELWDYQGITASEFVDLYQSDSVGKTYIALTRNRGIAGVKIGKLA